MGFSSVLSRGGVGMATVLVGLPVGTFAPPSMPYSDRLSIGVDVLVGELGARGGARSFIIAKGLGRWTGRCLKGL